MLVLLGVARPLGSAWLCFPLLLWTPASTLAPTGGELCRSWTSGGANPDGAFQCPGRPDGGGVNFCCGTCSAPYCCSSEVARLDQTRCPAGQQAKRITATPWPKTTPSPALSQPRLVGYIIGILVSVLVFVAIGCGVSYAVSYARRRICHWWRSRNRNQQNILPHPLNRPLDFDLLSSTFARPPSYCDDRPPPYDPPPYSVERPSSPRVLSPPVAQSGLVNANYQEDEAQPVPQHPSESALATGGSPSSQAGASSSALSPSDYESCGTRPCPSALAGHGLPGHDDDPPPYNVEDPYDSRALAAAWASLRDGSPSGACVSSSGPFDAEECCKAHPWQYVSARDLDDPPPYSVDDPYDSRALAAARASLQDVSPSEACASSSVPLSSDAEESQRPQPSASSPPRYNAASALDSDDPPPYSIDNPYDSQVLAAALATLRDPSPSQACASGSGPSSSDAEESHRPRPRQSASVEHSPPRYNTASAQAADDPPPCSIDDPCDSQTLAAADALATFQDPSPSQACASGPVLSRSYYEALGARPRTTSSAKRGPCRDAKESGGARPRTSASVGRGPCRDAEESRGARRRRSSSEGRDPPRNDTASALDCDDPPPYRAGDPYDSQAMAAAKILATLCGNTRVRLDFRDDLRDAPPKPSAMASPTLAPDDLPPYSVAVSQDLQILPCALDSSSVVQFWCPTLGATQAEVSPATLDRAPGVVVLEPVMEADELDLAQSKN